MVLSGAGLSTESGIPDYRGPTGALRRSLPMTYQTFTRDPLARQRYWARSQLGWRVIAAGRAQRRAPRGRALQQRGAAVRRRHAERRRAAPGRRRRRRRRAARQPRPGRVPRLLRADLPRRARRAAARGQRRAGRPWPTAVNPDGDVALDESAVATFEVVDCRDCGGVLKPDVVFFGENVPPAKVAHCYDLVERSRVPAGPRVVAGGDVGPAVREARGLARPAGRHRQPGLDPRRRARHLEAARRPRRR